MNDHRVLVAYSSRHGGTAEMAEWIAAELAQAGLPVDTRDVAAVDSLEGYDAVVLGSGVYMRSWRRDARRFLRRHRRELTDLRVWLFSSGPVDPDASVPNNDIGPGLARRAQQIEAEGHVTFGGVLRTDTEGWLARRLARRGMAGDYRNETAVRAWAESIAATLTGSTA
jgi:menaquinone-dependent protoporphyrinogen oxidase